MTFPFYLQGGFEYPTAMALATVLGFGFGFVLERAGFGRASMLVAQFFGTNMRVLKVMFSAIVTAALGIGVLAGFGFMDIAALSIPSTYLWPHLVGGLLLGVGFVVSGYCPGTAVVAAAAGHLDGVVTLLGVAAGALVFGFAYPAVESFYLSGDMGRALLTDLVGLPWPVLALGVALMAVGCFIGAEKIEGILARSSKTGDGVAPDVAPRTRKLVFAGFAAVAALGLVTLALPGPDDGRASEGSATPSAFVGSLELAQALVVNPKAYYVVDLRSPSACAKERFPTALCAPEDDAALGFMADLAPTRTVVLVADGELETVPSGARRYKGDVEVLRGGMKAFRAAVLEAPTPPTDATPEAIEDYNLRTHLHAYFTGAAAKAPVMVTPKANVTRAVKKGGGC